MRKNLIQAASRTDSAQGLKMHDHRKGGRGGDRKGDLRNSEGHFFCKLLLPPPTEPTPHSTLSIYGRSPGVPAQLRGFTKAEFMAS